MKTRPARTGKLRVYICGWCKFEFEQRVAKSDISRGKHGDVSTQVVCPKCKCFSPTWEFVR